MTNALRNLPSPAPETGSNTATGSVTELVMTRHAPDQAALLLPMIAWLSHNSAGRWISWVTSTNITRQLLEKFGVNTRNLRIIHCTDDQQALWITWEALARGNSHTVIASPGKLNDREFAELEHAANSGQCQGILIRERQEGRTEQSMQHMSGCVIH